MVEKRLFTGGGAGPVVTRGLELGDLGPGGKT